VALTIVALSMATGRTGVTRSSASGALAKVCAWTSGQHVAKVCPGGTLHIAVILGSTENAFFLKEGKGAQDAGRVFHVNVSVQGARTYDPVSERPVINAVIQGKPDAIIVDPTDAHALADLFGQITRSGIAVFTDDSDTANPTLRVTQFGSDQRQTGYLAGLAMAAALHGRGKVIALSASASNPIDSLRINGFKDAISKYPGITDLQNQYCTTDPTRCAATANAVMSANPNLNGIFGSGEPMLKGAATAIRDLGKAGQVTLGGLDASPEEVHDLKLKVDDFLVMQQPYTIGYESIRIAAEYLRGQSTSNSPLLPRGTKLIALPLHVRTSSVVAVNNMSFCPSVPGLICGLSNDPKIQQWYYGG